MSRDTQLSSLELEGQLLLASVMLCTATDSYISHEIFTLDVS